MGLTIFHIILYVPHNTIMELNNVMPFNTSFYSWKPVIWDGWYYVGIKCTCFMLRCWIWRRERLGLLKWRVQSLSYLPLWHGLSFLDGLPLGPYTMQTAWATIWCNHMFGFLTCGMHWDEYITLCNNVPILKLSICDIQYHVISIMYIWRV